MSHIPTPNRLHDLLTYTPDDGILRWKVTLGSRAKAGSIAGSKAVRGHLVVRLDRQLYMAHHLAWMFSHGGLPAEMIQHKNGNRTDNRIENLRAVSKKESGAHLAATPINPDNVHHIFRYEDGNLFWKEASTGKNRTAQGLAGYRNQDGYVKVEVGGKAMSAHRIIWLMHKGELPKGEIDHLNGIRHDNRIENLRDVIHWKNSENRRKATPGTHSGLLVVEALPSGQYRARIRTKGRLTTVGTYESAPAAYAAYVEAKRIMHEGCTL